MLLIQKYSTIPKSSHACQHKSSNFTAIATYLVIDTDIRRWGHGGSSGLLIRLTFQLPHRRGRVRNLLTVRMMRTEHAGLRRRPSDVALGYDSASFRYIENWRIPQRFYTRTPTQNRCSFEFLKIAEVNKSMKISTKTP